MMPFDNAVAPAADHAQADDGYAFELQGLSKDVTVTALHSLFDRDAPSIEITIPTSSPPPLGTSSSSTSLYSSLSASSTASSSFLSKPAASFNRSAELKVRTLAEAIALQNLQPRLEAYGLSLQMKSRKQAHPKIEIQPEEVLSSTPSTSMHDAFHLLEPSKERWRMDLREDSGLSVGYGAGGGMSMETGTWRSAKQRGMDTFGEYDSDDQFPSLSSWSPWSSGAVSSATTPSTSDPEADRFGPRNLYVLNLPVSLSQIEFEAMFAKIGNVEHACLLSMLDQNGRRRGFLLMRTHREAREVIRQVHGRLLEGCQLDISWARVQKAAASEIQRGQSQGMQRFLPPPLAPHDLRHEVVSYPAYRPSMGWTTSETIARHPSHPNHAVRAEQLGAIGAAPRGGVTDWAGASSSLPLIVIIQATTAQHTLDTVTTEASKYGNITHSCMLAPAHQPFSPFNDTLSTQAFIPTYAIRYHHAASAETASRMLPVLHGWAVRPATWTDIDRLSSDDRQNMLAKWGRDRTLTAMAPAPLRASSSSMLDAIHAAPFKPAPSFEPNSITPKAHRQPPLFTTPISPLSGYPKTKDLNLPTSQSIASRNPLASIWSYPAPADSWSKLPCFDDDDGAELSLPPTPIIKSSKPKTNPDVLSPSAVWWTGALRLDDGEAPLASGDPDDAAGAVADEDKTSSKGVKSLVSSSESPAIPPLQHT